jgi:hypothetical protein
MQSPNLMHQRCGRRSKDGPCRNWVMRGQTVCRMHGGSSPQALKKAEERLRDLEHPAISRVAELIDHAESDAVRFAAARYILELLGHKASVQVQTEQEIVITIRREEQPIILERAHGALSNG